MNNVQKIIKSKKIVTLSVFLFVLMGLGFLSSGVYAQNHEDGADSGVPVGGIQISPTKFIWTLDEGTTKTEKVNVKNYSDIEQRVTVEVEDFFVGSDGMEPKFFVPDDDHPLKARDIIEWITPPEDFTLAPGEGRWVEFTVAIPQGQPTNGYYGGIEYNSRDYSNSTSNNPTGPGLGTHRVLRGGCWHSPANFCRVNARHYYKPLTFISKFYGTGFRVVRRP